MPRELACLETHLPVIIKYLDNDLFTQCFAMPPGLIALKSLHLDASDKSPG